MNEEGSCLTRKGNLDWSKCAKGGLDNSALTKAFMEMYFGSRGEEILSAGNLPVLPLSETELELLREDLGFVPAKGATDIGLETPGEAPGPDLAGVALYGSEFGLAAPPSVRSACRRPTLLERALLAGKTYQAKRLILGGAKVPDRIVLPECLNRAAAAGNLAHAKYLVEVLGADPRAPKGGAFALAHAAAAGQREVFGWLAERAGTVDWSRYPENQPLLYFAALGQDPGILWKVLEMGSPVPDDAWFERLDPERQARLALEWVTHRFGGMQPAAGFLASIDAGDFRAMQARLLGWASREYRHLAERGNADDLDFSKSLLHPSTIARMVHIREDAGKPKGASRLASLMDEWERAHPRETDPQR
jgi:hypothetical protein